MAETRWVRTPMDSKAGLEIGRTSYGDFAIRNHQFRARTVVVTDPEMRAFIRAVKNGVFDKLLEEIR